jgi:organic hydroperoxide reductase OsmC/OhrA
MVKFPMKFEVEANASCEVSAQWSATAAGLAPIPSAIPPEFSGPGGGYSPEDLFAISVVNCMIATFKVYCSKSGLTFQNVEAKAVLTVDKLPSDGAFGMTQLEFTINVQGSSHAENVKKALEGAIKDCAVSNSIKTGKTFHLNVS